MKYFLLLLVCTLTASQGNAQFLGKNKKDKDKNESSTDRNSMYSLVYEDELSSHFGANHILSDHQLISRLQNKLIPTELFDGESGAAKFGNGLYRTAKLFLIDYSITYFSATAQRETFGSRYRAVQLGANDSEVNLHFPPPFTSRVPGVDWTFADSLSYAETALTFMAGFEASSILSEVERKNLLLNGEFAYEDALMYLYSGNDLSGYIAFFEGQGKDYLSNYVDGINALHFDSLSKYTVDDLKLYSYLDLALDPVNLMSIAGLFNYIAKGQEVTQLRFLKLGDKLEWLPGFSFDLAPFGPEFGLQNFIKKGNALFQLDFRLGDSDLAKSFGVGLKAFNTKLDKKEKLFVDADLNLWSQPEFTFRDGANFLNSGGFGGGGAITVNYRILKVLKAYVSGKIGYKGTGFMPGQTLGNDLFFHVGFAFR